MDEVRHDLLAGTGFSPDQQIHAVVFGNDPDQAPDAGNRGAFPDQLMVRRTGQAEAAPGVELLHAAADQQIEGVEVKGLLDIIVRPAFDRLDRLRNRPVGSHHDELDIIIDPLDRFNGIDAPVLAEPVVKQHKMREETFRQLKPFPDSRRRFDLVAEVGQTLPQRKADQPLIVDNQNLILHREAPFQTKS